MCERARAPSTFHLHALCLPTARQPPATRSGPRGGAAAAGGAGGAGGAQHACGAGGCVVRCSATAPPAQLLSIPLSLFLADQPALASQSYVAHPLRRRPEAAGPPHPQPHGQGARPGDQPPRAAHGRGALPAPPSLGAGPHGCDRVRAGAGRECEALRGCCVASCEDGWSGWLP